MTNKNRPDVILDQYEAMIAQESPSHPDSIPEEFLFSSKVIVLSNETEIPSYIPDDVLSFQINYNREQSSQLIDRSLESIASEYPEITLEDKKEILQFIRKNHQHGQKVTLSTFLHLALLWKSRDPNREVWMRAQLQAS